MQSRSDTEVVLRLYERMGLAALGELNGDFAIAILDQRIGELFLVRDRAGVTPLYYPRHAGGLLFASEIKALLAGGLPAELCRTVRIVGAEMHMVPPWKALFSSAKP